MKKVYQNPVVAVSVLKECEVFTLKSGEVEIVSSDDWYD